jgi:hypothetical protein
VLAIVWMEKELMHATGGSTILAGISRSVSRRTSLAGFGGAFAAAVAIRPSPARAGKVSKRVKKKCKKQISACQSSVAAYCATRLIPGDREDCEAELLPCCSSFKTCKAGAAYACLIEGVLPTSPT